MAQLYTTGPANLYVQFLYRGTRPPTPPFQFDGSIQIDFPGNPGAPLLNPLPRPNPLDQPIPRPGPGPGLEIPIQGPSNNNSPNASTPSPPSPPSPPAPPPPTVVGPLTQTFPLGNPSITSMTPGTPGSSFGLVFIGGFTGLPGGSFISAGPPLYLGTAEYAPRITLKPFYRPWFTDARGRQVATDRIYQAEEAIITAELTRFNEGIYDLLARRGHGFPRGLDFNDDLGLLIGRGRRYHRLIIQFPFVAKARMAAGNLPAGYRFRCSTLVNDDLDKLGTMNRHTILTWHALAEVPPRGAPVTSLSSASIAASDRTLWPLYDHDMSNLPPIN